MSLVLPDVRGLSNYKLVREAHDQTQQSLLEYTMSTYPQIPVSLSHELRLFFKESLEEK